MTIASSLAIVRYTGNNVTTVYPYTFKVLDSAHLVVTEADENDDNQTTLVLDTDYTVTGVGDESGGDVTLSSALATGHKLSIARVVPLTQTTDFENQGGFFADTHENSFDRTVMMAQQLQEQLDRCPKVSVTSGVTGDQLMAAIETYSENAQAAAAAAQAAQTAAETAQTNAETAETNAETAETNAGLALAAAEGARDAALLAQTAAETAETNAETAETNAEAAQGLAEAARDAALGAQSAAETAEGNAEAAQAAAEAARDAALGAQSAAEAAQLAAETAETNAETAESNAETAETNAELAATNAQQYANDLIINHHESTATAGQTYVDVAFQLASSLDNIACFIEGVKQAKSTLTRTSATRLTLGGALVGGEKIEIVSGAFSPTATADAAASAAAAALEAAAAAQDADAAASSVAAAGLPASLTGQGGKVLQVKGDESGYEFIQAVTDVSETPTANYVPKADSNGNIADGWLKRTGGSLPAGTIIPYAGSSVPTGFLDCDGSQVSRATYATLDTAIGTTWGAYTDGAGGAGTSHLRVPDLRGAFLRGTGTGSINSRSKAGPSVGAFQEDTLQEHLHYISSTGAGVDFSSGGNAYKIQEGVKNIYDTSGMKTVSGYEAPRAASETMPYSAGVKYCIKY